MKLEIKDFTFKTDGFPPIKTIAPASMYGTLFENGLIPDPFYGLNELSLTSLSENGCEFTSHFFVSDEMLREEFLTLTFYGLDTICDIHLNGKRLGDVKNMHRKYVFDVKSILKHGENELKLSFFSPVKYFNEKNAKHFLYMNGDTLPGASHLRKAYYMSGWDWGPKLPDMGIFRPVELESYSVDKLEDVEIRQKHENGRVFLKIKAEKRHGSNARVKVTVDGKTAFVSDEGAEIEIDSPKLWWVRGYGEQYLYEVKTELVRDGEVIDTVTKNIGLRTLTVSTAPDPDGKGSEFCFVNNGVKIFSMGANYVPLDNITSRVTKEKYDRAVGDAVFANYNTLRIWGGGYYPDDYFFELCDREGIIVWLDFMVACANVRLTEEFEAECIAEFTYNIKRLRSHPSLGIVCGNNEMESAVDHWDGVGDSMLVRTDYLRLYEHILPELSEKLIPDTFYWQSSPSSGGGFDDPDCKYRGDVHYWDVWHGNVPFTDYRRYSFRFCSEYGFESFPSMKTIGYFAEEKDMNCFSRVMENHQKCKGGNGKILKYLSDNYLYPHSFENLVYASQLLQADAIKYGVEHFRRERGYCMGSIYWQFNDCWPVASWSSVDYFGRYKALHYAARKFYAPVAMGLFLENGTLTVNVSNETRSEFRGKIVCEVRGSEFEKYSSDTAEVSVGELTSKDVYSMKVSADDVYGTYIYVDLYGEDGEFIMRQTELLTLPKHFSWKKPSFTFDYKDTDGGVIISVASDVFAKGVYLDFDGFDAVLSDNFFDLANETPYEVFVKTDKNAEEIMAALTVKSVYDIR